MVFGKGSGKKSYSSKTLSRFGKLGGRPKLYANATERARAFRLRKKQLTNPNDTLRGWKSYETILENKGISGYYATCDNCRSKVYGNAHGEQCQMCHQGTYQQELTITKRAGTSTERTQRQREKKKLSEKENPEEE